MRSPLQEKPCKRSIYYGKPLCWKGTRKGPFLHAKSNLTRFVSDEDWGPFYTNTICFFAPALVLFIAHYFPLLNDITLFCRNMNKSIAICSFGDRGHYRLYSIDRGFLNRRRNLFVCTRNEYKATYTIVLNQSMLHWSKWQFIFKKIQTQFLVRMKRLVII